MPRSKRPANPARGGAGTAQRRRVNGASGSNSASPVPDVNGSRVGSLLPPSAPAVTGGSPSHAGAVGIGAAVSAPGFPGGGNVPSGTVVPDSGGGMALSAPAAVPGTASVLANGPTGPEVPIFSNGSVRVTPSPSPSEVESAGGAARPLVARPMLSDTPASSAGAGPSSSRPPTPARSTTATPPAGAQGRTSSSPLANALTGSMRPLRLQLVAVATSVDHIVDSVRDILVKVEILTRGHERLSVAMQSLRGGVTVGFKDVMDGLNQMSVGAEGRVVGAQGDVAQALTIVGRVKAAFREDEKKRILEASSSGEVCINTSRTWTRLIHVTMDVRGVDRQVARDWLLSTIRLPARRDAQVLVGMRACVPILRAKPHLMQTLKDIVCSAFLLGVGLNREDITKDLSQLWMDNNAYMNSEMGLPSTVNGLGDMIRFLGGAPQMIDEPATVGGRPVVHCLLGHFALAACFIRSMLETKAGVRPRRRSGIGNGVFDQWETELCRADAALPRDTTVHYGLQLIDGADAIRGDVPDVDQDDSSDAEGNAGALVAEEDDANRDSGAANATGGAAAGFSSAGGASGAD